MFIGVFSKDKDKLIKNGYKFICTQKSDLDTLYIFRNNSKINFEKENIKVFNINKLYL